MQECKFISSPFDGHNFHSLRKHACSNILKISPPKNWKFSDKKLLIFFHISAQNIDCGYSLEPPCRGSSNEYPQSIFWAEIRKIMYTPVSLSFTIWKWGLWGSKLYRRVFLMDHYENTPVQIYWTFCHKTKKENYQKKNLIFFFFFFFSAQNIYCGYLVESPRRGRFNKYLWSMIEHK